MDRRESLKIASGMAVGGATVGALTLTSQVVIAQPANAGLKIGVVDESKVGDGYAKLKDTLKRYEDRANTLQPQLAARVFLTQDEGNTFDQIVLKDTPSANEQTQMANLVRQGNARETEYKALIGKGNRTEAENARMKELQTLAQNAGVGAQRVEDQLLSKIKTAQKTEVDRLVDAADKVISQLAEQQGLTMVVRKDAVVWLKPSVDITEAVLKSLNGR